MNIEDILKRIKEEYEEAITSAHFNGKSYGNGNMAKTALIRSQKLIKYLHEYIKQELINYKVNPEKIFPPPKLSRPELKLVGFLKAKDQDICVVPNVDLTKSRIVDNPEIEKIISINVRSQLSSLKKNIDTLHERTFAEALNLHLKYPNQCLGEVYLIPTHEYDDKTMLESKVTFKRVSNIEHYVEIFQAISNRVDVKEDQFKYERACLLIVDFSKDDPKLYSSTHQLIEDQLVPSNTKISLENLDIGSFVPDLLKIYDSRFGLEQIQE